MAFSSSSHDADTWFYSDGSGQKVCLGANKPSVNVYMVHLGVNEPFDPNHLTRTMWAEQFRAGGTG